MAQSRAARFDPIVSGLNENTIDQSETRSSSFKSGDCSGTLVCETSLFYWQSETRSLADPTPTSIKKEARRSAIGRRDEFASISQSKYAKATAGVKVPKDCLLFLTRPPDCQDESSQSCFRPSQRRFFPCEGDFGVMTEQTPYIRPHDQKHASVLSCFSQSCFQLPTRAKPRVQVPPRRNREKEQKPVMRR